MHTAKVRSAYQQSEAQSQIHPVKLIHLLYERVLIHLELAEEAIAADDAKTRGENLSKAIAIISELNASIKDTDNSDAAGFLRGLYSAILRELPKVAITSDTEIIRQSHRYLSRLLEIWETTAMAEAGLNGHNQTNQTAPEVREDIGASSPPVSTDYHAGGPKKFKTLDSANYYMHGVSVSI